MRKVISVLLGMGILLVSGIATAQGTSMLTQSELAKKAVQSTLGLAHPAFMVQYGASVDDITDDLNKIISEQPPYVYMLFFDKAGYAYGYYVDEDQFVAAFAKANKPLKTSFSGRQNQLKILSEGQSKPMVIDLKALEKK